MKISTLKSMKVKCGSLSWRGKSDSADHAIIAALSKGLPKSAALLLRVHDGLIWHYIDFIGALKIAGYKVKKTDEGFIVT